MPYACVLHRSAPKSVDEYVATTVRIRVRGNARQQKRSIEHGDRRVVVAIGKFRAKSARNANLPTNVVADVGTWVYHVRQRS